MVIIPAIDLKGGRCVRLRQGRPGEVTEYPEDPEAAAARWAREGAERLHVVDLDGAFQGRPVHAEVIRRIVLACGVPVQVGGGLRTDEDVQRALDWGAAMAIVGTRAIAEADSLAALARRFGERLAVGIDARAGLAQVRGWTETTSVRAADLAARAGLAGVRTVVCTDTSRDGMMRGVNAAAVDEICRATRCDVVASGGISSAADIAALVSLGRPNLTGAVVGKALYEGAVTLKELIEAGRGSSSTGGTP
jgi:phosphoribosylformimino-5-aminoimidazole carboxamide ribotide isomerase